MPPVTLEEMQQDRLVMSVAQTLVVANQAARAQGTDPAASLVTISQEAGPEGRMWRIHYGPRDYVNRRGGDLLVFVDEQSGAVQRILRGQ